MRARMAVTERQLNRATLARQLLLDRADCDAIGGVRRIVALQAQQPASPYVALWNRLEDFDATELDAAFASGAVVKATLMRIALHAVLADDYPAFHAAMQPTLRDSCLHDERFTGSGLDAAGADRLAPEVLEFAQAPRSNADVEAFLADRVPGPPRGAWWAIRRFGPFHHAVTGAPWSFGERPAYVAAPPGNEPDDPVGHLIIRYLEGFGPASAQDFRQFAMLRGARQAFAALDLAEVEGPGGATLFDLPGAEIPDEDVPAPPRLLGMWDSVLLAYADRSRVIPPDHRAHVTLRNGDVLPTLLIDGYVAGVWRPVDGGIEATAFERLDDAAWEGLEAEARGLVAFLAERDPAAYSRYAHWWEKLPGGEVRVLGG
jgi:hypothetical protein